MSYTDGRAFGGMNDEFTDAMTRTGRILVENAPEILTGDPNALPEVFNTPPSGGTPSFDFSQALAAVQQAPITQACKDRFNSIVNGIAAGTISGPSDLAWAQAMAQAAQGIGDYPSECIEAETMAWYWWLVIGGGAAVVIYLLFFNKRKK